MRLFSGLRGSNGSKSAPKEEREEVVPSRTNFRRRASTGSSSKRLEKKKSGGAPPRRLTEPGEYEEDNLAHVDTASANLRIRDVLRAKSENFHWLMEYAKSSHNEDMVMFWALVDNYASKTESSSSIEVLRMAEHITKCYLRVGSDREINVSARMRLKIIAQVDESRGKLSQESENDMERLSAVLFVETQQEVELLMDQNLEGFLQNRRTFWKRQVAWDATEASSGTHSRSAESETSLIKIASGGDADLETRLAKTMVTSVEQLAQAIMQGEM